MSHKHDDLDALNFDNDDMRLFTNGWIPGAVVDDAVDSSQQGFGNGTLGFGSDPFGKFMIPLGSATPAAATGESAVVNVAEGGKATIAGPGTASVVFDGSSGTLVIESAQSFGGQVSGLSGSDIIDLADIAFSASTQATFMGTASGGTLTISRGTQTATIALTGDYLSSTWSLSSDGHGGVNVVDPTASGNWQVMKVGAGGYADGLDESPDGTLVVRTDTNGAYLWNGSSWQQLVTSSSMPAAFIAANPVSSGQGVYEIQIAPSNSNIMYMMFDGYVFASTNKGATWTQTSFAQVTESSNDSFRMYGQKMAVDPNNPNIVYVGTPQNGLWVTTNGGSTWTQVTSVPVSGTSNSAYPGITGIMFDPAIGGAVNGVTQTIFASSYGNGVYESANGGSTWTQLSGGPSNVEYATVGPNGAYYAVGNNNQALWRYYNGVWTELLQPSDGIEAVVINKQNPNEIVSVAPSGYLRISYDGGTTWSSEPTPVVQSTDIPWEAAAQMAADDAYMYLTVGGAAFSTSNPNELILSTGTGSFDVMVPTSNPTAGSLIYDDNSVGIENLSTNEILVAPGGTPLLVSWDRPFIPVTNLDDYPTTYGPVASNNIVAGWSADYASSTPGFLVGLADWWGTEESGYSTNGGATWTKFATDIPGADSSFMGGTIAASTTQNFIWAPADGFQPYYTLNGGQTWNPITLPGVSSWSNFDWAYYLRTRTVTADRVLANTFYLYDPGTGVFETTNGGQAWSEVHAGALTSYDNYNSEIMSVPGEAGNLFFTAGIQGNGTNPPSYAQFMMSTNQGATWTAVPNVLDVFCFGFGAAAPGQSYPSIYIVGYVNNVYGIWQSTNKAQSWTQIGTQPTGELDQITAISGDPNVFGQVYVGFNGGGYAYLSAAPSVTSVTANPASGAETPGDTITFTVNMSETVTVSGGSPTLNLNNGGVATYQSGSGSSALTFTYTVSPGSAAVSALAISSTSPNGAAIQDSSGNAASLAGAVTTFSNISIADGPVTVAYYLANESALDAAGNVTIADTAANVAAAINTLNADSNVSAITLLGSTNLYLNVAETLDDAHALNAITNSSYGITVIDTGANVSANFNALNADSHVTLIAPAGGSQTMTLSLTQMLTDTRAVSLLDPFEITVTGTAASFLALAATELTAFGGNGVTLLDATDSDVSFLLLQQEALGAAGISVEQPFAGGTVEVVSYNASGGVSTIDYQGFVGRQYSTDIVTYGANGKPASASFSNGMTETWTYNANGSYSVALAGVTGAAYTSYTINYGAKGRPASASFSNGMTETWTYNANGSYKIAVAGVTGAAFTSYTINYGTNGKPTSASFSNGMTETWAYNADGSYDLYRASIPNASYTSLEAMYSAANVVTANAVNMTNGTGHLVLAAGGLTISSASGALSLTTGADTFTLHAHATEAIFATGYNTETFGFAAGFGADSVTGLVAGGSGSDVLSLHLSMFNGLNSSNTSAQNVAILLSDGAMVQSGANVTLADTSGDVLTLMGVTTTTLSQNASSVFKFS